MTKLPRWQPNDKVTGEDLNFILGILDTADVVTHNSATNSGVTGDGLKAVTPSVTGSLTPGGAPTTVRGLTGSYGIDNFSQSHTAYALLSWTPNPISDFISRYDIYYHKGSDPTLYNLSVGGDVNSVRVNNLFPGNTYSFSAQAHDAANRSSAWCPEVDVSISLDADPPAIPTGLAATATAVGVYLTWTEVGPDGISNDLKQYQIAVSLDGGGTYPTTRTVGPGNSYFYTPTTSAQGTVFFKIATLDWTGNLSDYSTAVSAVVGTILGPVTINPGGLGVDTNPPSGTSGGIAVGGGPSYFWSSVVAANSFQRYGISYGIYWNTANANYTVTDVTFNQSIISDENGTFTLAGHSGPLTSPQTFAAWNAVARKVTFNQSSGLVTVPNGLTVSAGGATVYGDATIVGSAKILGPIPFIDATHPSFGGSLNSTALQGAFNAVPAGGGIVYIGPGTWSITADVNIPTDNTVVLTAGKATNFLASTTGIKMLKAINRSGLYIGGIYYDGQYQSGNSGLYMDGCQNCYVDFLWADRFIGTGAAVNLQATSRNCCRNVFAGISMFNGQRGLILNGSSGSAIVPNNLFHYVYLNGLGGTAASTLIDFQNWTDSNDFLYTDLGISFAGSVGIVYNSGSPGALNNVYENHFRDLKINVPAGQTGVVVNKTDRRSWIMIRPSGGGTAVTINSGGLIGYLPGSRTMADTDLTQYVQISPSNPTGTVSGGAVMMGLNGGFTPQSTGNVIINITGDAFNSVAGAGALIVGFYGTGTPPVNGAAFTGTAIGVNANRVVTSGVANAKGGFAMSATIIGMTPQTAYWIDLAVAQQGGGTATIENLNFTVQEMSI